MIKCQFKKEQFDEKQRLYLDRNSQVLQNIIREKAKAACFFFFYKKLMVF